MNEILTIIVNSIINTFHDFNNYIKNEEKNFKSHNRKTITKNNYEKQLRKTIPKNNSEKQLRKTITKNIAIKNLKIIRSVLKIDKLNDDKFIELNRCFISKEVR